jgi:enoyl-CoA hydratase
VPLIDGGTVRLPRLVGTGRALDLILSGRSVDAAEALAIGLVNRLVPAGEALTAAQSLARQLAAFPQTCLREDRASVLEQEGLDEAAALANEFRHGLLSLAADTLAGAARFASGEGRHGAGVG